VRLAAGQQHALHAVQLERESAFGFGTGAARRGRGSRTGSRRHAGRHGVSYQAGGGEPGYIAPDPLDTDIFYSGTNNGGYIDKFNRRNGTRPAK
jgi:hypothetical protein